MVSLTANTKRKQPTEVSGPSKRAKRSTSSRILSSYQSLPDVNLRPGQSSDVMLVFVWGTGSMCELGLGPNALTKEVKRPRLNPFLAPENLNDTGIIDFAVGGMHVLALDSKNRVWSWGNNDNKVLGRDTTKAKENLKSVDDSDSEDEDGDLNEAESTPGLVQNLPNNNEKIVQLIATDNLSGVLYENGEVYTWGTFRGNEGLMGFDKNIAIQDTPCISPSLRNVVQLAGGKDHVLALDSKGIVYAWGNGQQFQLGRKILERHKMSALLPQQFGLYDIKYIACGDYHCFAISTNNEVFAWGLNQYGQCGVADDGQLEDGSLLMKPTKVEALSEIKLKSIVGGEHHSLALTEDGQVLAWGRIDMQELGIPPDRLPKYTFKDAHGRARSIPRPTLVTIGKADHPKIKAIGTGSHHSFAVTEDGVVYSWGFGDTYAPGLGPLDDDVKEPTRIYNTATKAIDISMISGGGQFSVSGGRSISSALAAERLEKYEAIDG